MNRHYLSDLDEDEPPESSGTWLRLAIIVVDCLIGLALFTVCFCTYAAGTGLEAL